MRPSRHRVVASMVACLAASVLLGSPARAASPPQLTVDSAQLTFTEGTPAEMTGTWAEPDGDAVAISADIGEADLDSGYYGKWTWRPPAMDGPLDTEVTVTATDIDGSTSASFAVHVDNAPPEAWTTGASFVPVSSASDRVFLWSALDPIDQLVTTADCGSGTVTATGDGYISGTHTIRCAFDSAGVTAVGVRSTDDDGATTDARKSVRATTQVASVADGRLVINGPNGNDQLGGAIATPDLNGDGKADIVIGGTATSNGPVHDPGYVMVVFGRSAAGTVDLGALAAGAGFRITGAAGEVLGRSLASAGDINGDGLDDLLIGATEGAGGKGIVYVVFGSTSSQDVDLGTMTSQRGARITGTHLADYTGTALAGIGDANGDGIDDIVIGSPGFADGEGRADLLFGRSSFTDIDLGALQANRGIHIDAPGRETGKSVAGGDVNGDGRSDIIVGSASGWDSNAVVVYGKKAMMDVDAATMSTSQGFEIGGGEGLGVAAVASGDMNGDGYDDVAIDHQGSSYPLGWAISVVLGGATNASIPYLSTAPASRLIRIYSPDDTVGGDMTTLDWNGDGRSDLLVGGSFDGNNGSASGSAYLIKGASSLTNLDLSTYDPRWFRVDGDNPYAFAGDAVGTGDVTGDGVTDLLVGAPGTTTWTAETMRGRVGVFSGIRTDTTAPSVTSPTRQLLVGQLLSGSSPLIRLGWTGSDSQSGLGHYLVAQSTNGGPWLTVASTSSTHLDRALATGNTYRFRVRAVDRVGNWSSWKYGTTFQLLGYQDTSSRISYRNLWRTGVGTLYAGGTTRFATAAGARATLTFTGRQVAFAAPAGPTRGTGYVYINGRYRVAFTLNSTTNKASRVIVQWSWSTVATRTISIVVVGTQGHPRVDIDKFIVVR